MTDIIDKIIKIIIDKIMELYRNNGYECQTDYIFKRWGTCEMCGIYKPWKGSRPTKAYCSYGYHDLKKSDTSLAVTIPRRLRPENVKQKYGLECWGDPDEFKSNKMPNHYAIFIPIKNGLLNGVFTIEEKKGFFLEMASLR